MKIVISLMLLLSIESASARVSRCPLTKTTDLTPACRAEVMDHIQYNKRTNDIRGAVASSFNFRNCKFDSPDRLAWQYHPPGAVGPYLEIFTFVSCEADEEYDGYWISGKYNLDKVRPTFTFIGIKVNQFE